MRSIIIEKLILTALKPIMPLSHTELCYLMQSFYPYDVNSGVCLGLAHMRRQEFLLGKGNLFYPRLKRIKEELWPLVNEEINKQKALLDLDPEEEPELFFAAVRKQLAEKLNYRKWSEFFAFFDGILLYIYPDFFPELFPAKRLIDFNAVPAKSLLHPTPIINNLESLENNIFSAAYSNQDLNSYFACLSRTFAGLDFPISLQIATGSHAFTIDYHNKKWFFTDINNLEKDEHSYDEHGIRQRFISCYGRNIIFSTRLFIAPNASPAQRSQLQNKLRALNQAPKWIALNQLSKEKLIRLNNNDCSLLYVAVQNNDVQTVKNIVKFCSQDRDLLNEINYQEEDKVPLFQALLAGYDEIVDLLVPNGVSVQKVLLQRLEQQAQIVLDKQQEQNPTYVQHMHNLYAKINAINEFAQQLKNSEEQKAMNRIVKQAREELDYFICCHPKRRASEEAFNYFKDNIVKILHSENHLIGQHESWKPLVFNILLALITAGSAIVLKAIHSYYTCGQIKLFFSETAKQTQLNEFEELVQNTPCS